jgi:outer membrane protein assembly factor BamB
MAKDNRQTKQPDMRKGLFTVRNWSFGHSLPLLLPVAAIAGDAAGNWPQWRGPQLNGTAQATNLAVEWSETHNVRWKTRLPAWSGATPIIWGNNIFVMSPDQGQAVASEPPVDGGGEGRRGRGGRGGMDPGGQALILFCLNRRDGAVLWQREVDRGNQTHRKQNNSSPSPVTDGNHVWSLTGNGVLTCFDFTGKEKWKRNIQRDYGRFGLNWGYASSPLLVDDRLVIPVLHGNNTDEPSYVLAVNKIDGRTLWRKERPTDAPQESPDAYVTPQLLRVEDRAEIILNGGDIVTGHDLATGNELWRADVLNPMNNGNYRIIPSCLVAGDLIIAPSRINPMVALRTGGRGDVTETHVVWTSANGPDVPTPVSDGRYLWFVTGDRSLFSCVDLKSGQPLYDRERLPNGTYSASPVLADAKIYLMNENCETVVLDAGSNFRILATNALEGANGLSSPAVAGSELFLRTSEAIYCVAVGASSTNP